ncbi:MAG TPA: pyridoxal-phosphate dependent enzyme [Solirubrobacteraceae bacterium]|nr:pyridoxal-phosphate dependent enzyme [Solirubrobacteraceae bacterium]
MATETLQNKPCGGRYGDIVQSIGHTPLIELKRLSPKPGVRIWAKLESRNPTGSIKDRVARALIEDAEAKGLIRPGQTILEPTSGNTGISLAMICGRKGYDLKVVMPENVTRERTELLRMYGADIVYSEGSKGSNGAVEKALDMAEKDASYYMPYQYGNPANPDAHYNGTALEILEELDEIAAFVAGLGTGGTLMGNGRRLKEELGDACKIVAAEPMQGEPVQGLRSLDDGFIPPIIDLSLLDRKIFVTNHDAITWTRKLLDEERLFAGVSTGAIARVAVRIAGEIDEGNVVFIVCDDGWKYLSSGIYTRPVEEIENLDSTVWWYARTTTTARRAGRCYAARGRCSRGSGESCWRAAAARNPPPPPARSRSRILRPLSWTATSGSSSGHSNSSAAPSPPTWRVYRCSTISSPRPPRSSSTRSSSTPASSSP